MISLALKWFARATLALAFFSAITAIYMYYQLNFGSCQSGGEACQGKLAVLYSSGVGIVGFSVTAFAAYFIAKGFRERGQ